MDTSPNQRDKDRQAHKEQCYEEDYLGETEMFCAEFGCGRKLTMEENLYGNFCNDHSGKGKKNLVNIVDGYMYQ